MAAAYYDSENTDSESSDVLSDVLEYTNDDCDLNMQCEVSDFEEDEEENGIQPYQFEPEYEETDSESDSEGPVFDQDETNQDRLHTLEWCNCGSCTILPTVTENKCCEELQRVRETRDDLPQKVNCIIEHPGFRSVCLDIYVLRTAYYQYRVLHGEIPESPERYRYTAYRQFVRWCWGYLGKTIRVPLPSCAVTKIRETFPSLDGVYTGFNYSD